MSADSTTFAPAAKIREVDVPPVACASCNGQYPDRRHVDFGAGYEGAALPPEAISGIAGAKVHHVDDLIICDECLTAAATVLGLGDLEEAREVIAGHEERIGELGEKLAGAVAYISQLEKAAKDRETLEEALKPKPKRARR